MASSFVYRYVSVRCLFGYCANVIIRLRIKPVEKSGYSISAPLSSTGSIALHLILLSTNLHAVVTSVPLELMKKLKRMLVNSLANGR